MMSSDQICSDAQEQFDIHELGLAPLDPVAKRQMEKHFESCEPCRIWLSTWQLIKLNSRELEQLEVPSTVLSSIMSRVDAPQVEARTADARLTDARPVPELTLAMTPAIPVVSAVPVLPAMPGVSAMPVVPAAVPNVADFMATTPLFKSDGIIALVAVCALLLAGAHYAAEGFEGSAAWLCSFVTLFVAHHFLQATDRAPIYKT